MAVGDVGGGPKPEDRRAWRRSDWIQATLILGFLAVVAGLDWVLNESLTYVGVLGIGIAGGLAVGAVLRPDDASIPLNLAGRALAQRTRPIPPRVSQKPPPGHPHL